MENKVTKLTEWVKEPTVSDLQADYTNALPAHKTHVGIVKGYLDNLHVTGEAEYKSNDANKSSINPQVIRKQAEWRYASLTEAFLNMAKLFTVSPVSAEDRTSAIQNELLINNQFNTSIDKVTLIDTYARTLVDEGTAIFRVGWDFQTKKIVEKYIEHVEEPLTDPTEIGQTIASGQLPIRIREVERERTVEKVIKNDPTIEITDYRSTVIDPTCKGDLSKAMFIVHEYESSLGELKAYGDKYKNLNLIDTGQELESELDNSRNEFEFTDKARKKFTVKEYWGYKDINNDGTLVSIIASYVGNVVIEMRENPYPNGDLPFVLVQYLPNRKAVYGESDGAMLVDNQKIVGAITRGMIDTMARSANGQVGRMKKSLDATNRIKFNRGEDYEYNQSVDPSKVFYMHKFPEISRSAYDMIAMNYAEADSLTGVKAFSEGVSGDSLGSSVGGINSAMAAAAKRELAILRRMAKGLENVARKVIAMNAVFLSEEQVIRVTNEEFVPIRRDDLEGNIDLRLSISTPEADEAKSQKLAFMLQTATKNMDAGMYQLVLSDVARLSNMPTLAKNIEEFQPPQDPAAEEEQALRIQLLKRQIYNEEAKGNENNANAALDNAKAITEGAKAEHYTSLSDLADLNFLEQESGVQQERNLEKDTLKHHSTMDLKAMDVFNKTPAKQS